MDFRHQPTPDAYHVAIFCATEVEYTAIVGTIERLDKYSNFRSYPRQEFDENHYVPGILSDHYVLIIRLTQTGKIAATNAASTLRSSFPAIRLCILMGICGAAPRNLLGEQIILGDIIISTRIYNSDRGRLFDSELARYNDEEDLPDKLRKSIKGLVDACSSEADRPAIEKEINNLMDDHQQEIESLICPHSDEEGSKHSIRYQYPGAVEDRLFENNFVHRHQQRGACDNCDNGDIKDPCRRMSCTDLGCNAFKERLILRQRLQTAERPKVKLHFGPYACADHVLRTARIRENRVEKDNVIAFEMEAAGIWDIFPTLVVKGVSDYADSHKNKVFQGYAAVSSSKAVKCLLRRWAPLVRPKVTNLAEMVPGNHRFNKIMLNRIFDADAVHRHRFQDREEPMAKLLDLFVSRDAQSVSGEMALLIGPPGSGKTALYETFYKRTKEYYWAWWTINCKSIAEINDDLDEIAASCDEIATVSIAPTSLKLSPEANRRAAIATIKKQKKPWLLILNDVDDGRLVRENLQEILDCSRGSFLIVSRDINMNLQFPAVATNVIRLKGLPGNYGVKLFKEIIDGRFDMTDSDQACSDLVRKLDYLPEAIRLAALYLCENTPVISSPSLVTQVQEFLRVLNDPEDGLAMGIFDILFTKFTEKLNANVDQPQAQDALGLLYILAFLSSTELPYSILQTALRERHEYMHQKNGQQDRTSSQSVQASWFSLATHSAWLWDWTQRAVKFPRQQKSRFPVSWPSISWLDSNGSLEEKSRMLDKALALLERCGLIEWSRKTATIIVKRLIQQCSYDSLIKAQTADVYAVRTLIILSYCIDSRYDEQSKSSRRLLHRHLEAHRQRFSRLDKLFDMLHPVHALVLCMRISVVYFEYGNIATAKEIQVMAIEKATPSLSDQISFAESDLMLQAQSQLAASLFDLDGFQDRDKAVALRLDVMNRREKLWLLNQGDLLQHRLYINSLADLADSYDYTPDNAKQAVAYRERVCEELNNSFGNSSEDTTEAMQRLARSCFRSGQRDRALSLRRSIFHRHTGLNEETFSRQKDFNEKSLSALSDLAESVCSFGHWSRAMEMRELVLATREKYLDPSHHDIMVAKINLSCSHMKMRQYENAIRLRAEVYNQYDAAFGLQNGVTLKAYCQLGNALARSDAPEFGPLKAYAMHREAIEVWDGLNKESPVHTLDRMDLTANMADALERYLVRNPTKKVFPFKPYLPGGINISDQAIELRSSICEIIKSMHGENNLHVLIARNALADCYGTCGRLEEALDMRERILAQWRELMGEEKAFKDLKYQAILRSQARTYDLLAAFWAPSGTDFYAPVEPIEPEMSSVKSSTPFQQISGSWRSSHSSDAVSGYGSEHAQLRSGYLEKACATWRELLRLQRGDGNSEAHDKNASYDVIRTMRDLGDSLRQYDEHFVGLEQQEQRPPDKDQEIGENDSSAGTPPENPEDDCLVKQSTFLKEAKMLWTRARDILASPDRLGPNHQEVLALTERIDSLEDLPPLEMARIEDWVDNIVSCDNSL